MQPRPDLVFVGLLSVTDGGLAGHDVEVDAVVAADAPAAPLPRRHPLQLQQHVVSTHPLLASCRQAVHAAVHVHGPQQRDRHGDPCTETQVILPASQVKSVTSMVKMDIFKIRSNMVEDKRPCFIL